MAKSSIEWTDATWNPIAGCSKVSAGCKNCYAERMAKRLIAMGKEKYVGTVDAQGRWTGKINFDEAALVAPLRWKKPRMVFVNSMSDLFHEAVPDKFIDRVFAVMALCPQHTFQVLTKRPERMAVYLAELAVGPRVLERIEWTGAKMVEDGDRFHVDQWPLPNVWLGGSVENQEQADKRIPKLLECPAAVRFLSCEPLLGAVRVDDIYHYGAILKPLVGLRWEQRADGFHLFPKARGPKIDWVICGGESGPNARPMHPDWARGLRDQCQAAEVRFFFKQWGIAREFIRDDGLSGCEEVEAFGGRADYILSQARNPFFMARDGRVFASREAIPDELPARLMERLGKKGSGRLLDGREWNELPTEGHGTARKMVD